ncbi:hypothetical protein ACQZ6C_10810 [Rhizobium rhizogenes]
MVTINQALNYINNVHVGYQAFACEDGLVFKSEVVLDDRTMRHSDDQDDNWFEELEVFPIVNGMVDLAAIRAHMGY